MKVGPQRRVVLCVKGGFLHLVWSHGHLSDKIFSQMIDDLPNSLSGRVDRFEGMLSQALSMREPDVMSGYSLWEDRYDSGDNPIVEGEEVVNNDLIGFGPGLRVLDVGCGISRNALSLTEIDAHVVGYDLTPELLSVAKRKAADLHLDISLHSGHSDAVSDADFGLVLCCFVLGHDEDLARALHILSRFLKPGGCLIVSGFYPFFLLPGFQKLLYVEDDAFDLPNTKYLLSDYVCELKNVSIDLLDVLEPKRDPAYLGISHELVLLGGKRNRRPARAV